MKAKLSSKGLDTFRSERKEAGKSGFFWDTDLSGFGAYVSAKGEVSFVVQKWAGGREGKAIRYVIGKAKNGMELPEARTLAAQHIGDIAKGMNPVDTRRKVRQDISDRLNGTTVSEALDLYFGERKATRYRIEAKKNLAAAFSELHLLKSPVSEVTRSQVIRMVQAKRSVGEAAPRNLFAALRPFFAFCVDQEIIGHSPVAGMKSPPRVESRDRVLSALELKAFWRATESLNPRIRSFYRTLLLTGQRRSEVSGMTWDEVDLENATWTIPKERAKNHKAHIVHLSSPVVTELRSCKERSDEALKEMPPRNEAAGSYVGTKSLRESSAFVFPGARKGKGKDTGASLSGYSKTKLEIDKLMKDVIAGNPGELPIIFKPWRLHDFRRTLVSYLANRGVATDVADRLLNHVSGEQAGVKGVYQRYDFLDERKAALELWGKHVLQIVTHKPPEHLQARMRERIRELREAS